LLIYGQEYAGDCKWVVGYLAFTFGPARVPAPKALAAL